MRRLNWFLLVLVVGLLAVGFYCTYIQPSPAASPTVEPTSEMGKPAPTTAPSAPSDDNDPLGIPVSTSRHLQLLHKTHYTIGYDNERREPAWVSYALAGPIVHHDIEHRPDRFADDPEVSGLAHTIDYSRSGYDRGHMCPAFAEFSRFGPEGMNETFITSNIIPQVHGLNAGRWEELETLVAGGHRSGGGGWAERYSQVFVTDGPIYKEDLGSLRAGEPIPSACFMIVERQDGQSWKALAFELPNAATRDSLQGFLVSIRQVEKDTGLDFDGAMPGAEQDAIETMPASALW